MCETAHARQLMHASLLSLNRSLVTVFSEHESFCCSISLPNLHLERDFYEQNQYYIEAVPYGADFNHSSIGAVQGPVESMGRGLRFLYAHTDSASPDQTLMREL